MQDCPPGLGIHRGGSFEHVVDVVFGDGLAAQLRIRAVAARREPAAGHVDDDAADLDAGHALGRVNGQAHGMLRRMKIDHRAALDAVRALMADAEHLAAVRATRAAPRTAPSASVGRSGRRSSKRRCRAPRGWRSCAPGSDACAERAISGSWLGALLGRVGFRPGGGRIVGQPHEHLARNAEVERHRVLFQNRDWC